MTHFSEEIVRGAAAMFTTLNPGIRYTPEDAPYYCQAFAAGVAALLPLPSINDDKDWVIPSAVCAYDIARCEMHGQEYPKQAMSATNRQSIAPMIRAAITQAIMTITSTGSARV